MRMLERLALTLHRSVCGDPEAEWRELSQEDRDDAMQWARDSLASLMEMAESVSQEGGATFVEAVLLDEPALIRGSN